ncbi:MAG TPA: thioredoxin fold domain-containing protein [Spirochaetota bacterium]|jgi:thioredoxin-related protein|nr:MAG: Disulfide bond reductase DsbH precursor [Spirochaetes bacterium ADurb.BinA120]HPI15809.1 thioredoxin fold domain-containing protein [Spirochaetota bacterium]HPO44837.1 thioredoxin fold domain-containing protein [Spirochaetota bacterium]
MRKCLPSAIMTLLITFPACGGSGASGGGIQWKGFEEGVKIAKSENKPAVIDFYASWCHWCTVMEKDTFANADVVKKLSEDFVPIKIDMESSKTISIHGRSLKPADFAAMMGVRGLPSLVFMDKNGEFITQIPGYIKADTFLPILSYIKSECYLRHVSFEDYLHKKTDCGGK